MSGATTRYAAVLSTPRGVGAGAMPNGRLPRGALPNGGPPPGIDAEEFRLALLEDTYEVVAGLELVTPALVLDPPVQPDAEAVTWPGTAIVREPTLPRAFAALHALGAREAALLVPDVPDLPPLLLGKLFRALGSAPAAACRAEGTGTGSGAGPAGAGRAAPANGLVALAARLPLPAWLDGALRDVDLDTPDALARLRAAAPRPGLVPQAPGWHRIRTAADVRLLDPGLEGWENTRALLAGDPLGR